MASYKTKIVVAKPEKIYRKPRNIKNRSCSGNRSCPHCADLCLHL